MQPTDKQQSAIEHYFFLLQIASQPEEHATKIIKELYSFSPEELSEVKKGYNKQFKHQIEEV